jgi:hypothetical protein
MRAFKTHKVLFRFPGSQKELIEEFKNYRFEKKEHIDDAADALEYMYASEQCLARDPNRAQRS